MSHRNAPLTPQGRLLLCRRIEAGATIASGAEAMGISRQCASKWWHRYVELGAEGLHDRPSRPRRSPRRLPEALEAKICRRRRSDKVGPERLAVRLELPASTIYRSCAATTWAASTTSTGLPPPPSAATSGSGPVSWST